MVAMVPSGLRSADGSRVHIVEQNGLRSKHFTSLPSDSSRSGSEFSARRSRARLLPKIARKIADEDLVILDPPRSGCHPEVLDLLNGIARPGASRI